MPILILMLLTTLLSGCPSHEDKNRPVQTATRQPQPTLQIMRQSITPVRLELPSQAPQIWKNYQQEKPALVLFSEHPFLDPTPPALKEQIATLITQGSAEDFRLHNSLQRVEPILLPGQTLRAALEQNFFAEVIWYFPSGGKLEEFKAEDFRRLMTSAGFLSAVEAEKLQLSEEGVLAGEVQGTPLRIIHPLAALPEISHPIVLHVDLGYFRGLFKNEIRTPIYGLLQETVQLLRDSNWKTLAVTLSTSTEGGNYSLATRFLMADLAQLLETPQLLERKMPESWATRKDSMFNQNFFQESKARELIQQNAKKFPSDPTVQYDDYLLLIQSGDSQRAFAQLDKVVALNPGYAEEYLALSETGQQKGWNEQTITLLDKASRIYPQNPFILIQKADLQVKAGQTAAAIKIFAKLETLPWSKVYYPEMQDILKQRLENSHAASQ